MSYIKGINRNQILLFPEVIEDYIDEDNPVRFIDAFVDSLNLSEFSFKYVDTKATGRPPYNPADLLKLYIYGYLNNIRSSRKLENETHRNVEVIWLLQKLRPDFKTIADFRKDNRKALKKVCREFTLLCKKLDLFGAELIAIDGSKLRAVNNKQRNYTSKKLKTLIKRIDEKIEEYFKDCEEYDEEESSIKKVDKEELNQKIKQMQERKDKYKSLLNELEESGESQISLTDPESRRMQTSQGQQVCYNAQIAVDEKHKLIAAEDVTNEVTDLNNLSDIAIETKEVLEADDLDAVADMGYYNGSEVKKCMEYGITAYIEKPNTSANTKRGLYGKDEFLYNSERDCYICPAGEELTYRFDTVEKGRHIRYYTIYACTKCPLKPRCTRNKEGRRITRWIHEDIQEEMEKRVKQNSQLMRKRKYIVEHPFGTIKRWMNQGYFLTKRLEKVKTEFGLTVMAYNMKRALNIIGVKDMIKVLL